jgi:hypothetical protein
VKAKAAARFAEEGAGKLHLQLHQARLRELVKGPNEGKYPASALVEWAAIAATAEAREGVTPSPREALALDVMDAARAGNWTIPTTRRTRA